MTDLLAALPPEMARFGLLALAAFCRIGGCFLVLPGLSSGRVPATVRALAALGLTVALVPSLGMQEIAVPDGFALARLVAGETLVGLFFGLVARFYLLALGFAAQALATTIGFSAVPGISVTDDEPSAALGTLVTFSALVVLFQLDFHHLVLRALVASYDAVPPMAAIRTGAALNDLLAALVASFLVALRLVSPFVAYALVANLAIGIVNKLAPQIPVYFVSLPFLIAGGLALFHLFVPAMLILFADGFATLPAFR